MSDYRTSTFHFANHERVQLMDMVRELILERRQFAVAPDDRGLSLSTPLVTADPPGRAA